MRMLTAKAESSDTVISAWCAPGALSVNYRIGFLRDIDGVPYGSVQWLPVQTVPYEVPVWDVVEAMSAEFPLGDKVITTPEGVGRLMYVFDVRQKYGYECRVPESVARRLVSENRFWDYDVTVPQS